MLQTLREFILKTSKEVLPKSALGKACTYALNQWERLNLHALRDVAALEALRDVSTIPQEFPPSEVRSNPTGTFSSP